MKFVQDLLNWVDEMQVKIFTLPEFQALLLPDSFSNLISFYLKVQLDRTEWGSDLPSVESHLENHKNVHQAIEEFESSLKEAKISEVCEFEICMYFIPASVLLFL